MRAEVCRAERLYEVRQAARSWARAGAIDETALAAVVAAHPDDRVRLGPALRALAFVLTGLGAALLLAFAAVVFSHESTLLPFLFLYGAGLLVLAEWQVGALRRAQGGTETATAWAGVACLAAGAAWSFDRAGLHGRDFEAAAWLAVAVLCGGAAHRFGGMPFAAAACGGGLAFLSRMPAGRLAVGLFGAVLLWLGQLGEDRAELCPSHRRGAVAAQWVGAAGLYLAFHIGSWDSALFEEFQVIEAHRASALRPVWIAATVLLPIVFLALGVVRRRRNLVLIGAAALVASLVTLRAYVHVAPPWVVLLLSGLGSAVLALGLERWLRRGANGIRGGFTADPLFDDERRLRTLEVAIAAAQAGPARSLDRPPGGFEGGGGSFGGGGASDRF